MENLNNEVLLDILYNNPLALLAIKDKQVIQQFNELIPYSTAFEIECNIVDAEEYTYESNQKIALHNEIFKSIPDIMSVNNDIGEQRYRIPSGIRGIICVYNIANKLKIHSLLNPSSGIHYHVDCTDCFNNIYDLFYSDLSHTKYILDELDTWLEGDTATNRGIGSWFKFNSLQTIEFRMGEMTFEYRKLIQRIIHCNAMVKKFKDMLGIRAPIFLELDSKKIISYLRDEATYSKNRQNLDHLNRQLRKIKEVEKSITATVLPVEEAPIIRKRTHIIKHLS